jgi:hypothetical protein
MVFIFVSLSLQMERKGESGPVVPENIGDGLVWELGHQGHKTGD